MPDVDFPGSQPARRCETRVVEVLPISTEFANEGRTIDGYREIQGMIFRTIERNFFGGTQTCHKPLLIGAQSHALILAFGRNCLHQPPAGYVKHRNGFRSYVAYVCPGLVATQREHVRSMRAGGNRANDGRLTWVH